MTTPSFDNHHHALNYYKKKYFEVDQRLQDFLVHHDRVLQERLRLFRKELDELAGEIKFHQKAIEGSRVYHSSEVSSNSQHTINVVAKLAPHTNGDASGHQIKLKLEEEE